MRPNNLTNSLPSKIIIIYYFFFTPSGTTPSGGPSENVYYAILRYIVKSQPSAIRDYFSTILPEKTKKQKQKLDILYDLCTRTYHCYYYYYYYCPDYLTVRFRQISLGRVSPYYIRNSYVFITLRRTQTRNLRRLH